jgi:hypothetical protein
VLKSAFGIYITVTSLLIITLPCCGILLLISAMVQSLQTSLALIDIMFGALGVMFIASLLACISVTSAQVTPAATVIAYTTVSQFPLASQPIKVTLLVVFAVPGN